MTEIPLRATCPCGGPLPPPATVKARRPQTYCSNDCRRTYGRFGQTYGQVAPKDLKVYGWKGMR